eukprot:GHVU01042981.1.p1 GENE.GHVU01042981.1~~GHVU01042981.1.p1  ORF type:complete len:130 (+),score=2.07 GHVU01042981.1:319-708(+)
MSGCQCVEGSHDGGLVSQRDRDLWYTMGTLERDRTNIANAGCSRAKLLGNHSQSHHLGPYRVDVLTLILVNRQHRFPAQIKKGKYAVFRRQQNLHRRAPIAPLYPEQHHASVPREISDERPSLASARTS